jgi:CubicO group peptidase (beta-lactamase class C family)
MADISGTSAAIQGTWDTQFEGVKEAFQLHLDRGEDIGASACVFVGGQQVADIWGGYFDGTFTRSWERHTIAQMFSSTKTVTALCALVLADHGELDLDAPVAKYWPEFAQNGKSGIAVKQLLGHTSGMAGWAEHMTLQDMCNVPRATEKLARQAPLFEPGRTAAYHGFSQGHLVGEVIRRITGKSLGRYLAQDIAGPVGAGKDLYIGTPEDADPRVSLLIQGKPLDEPANDNIARAVFNPRVTPQDTWALPWRRAEMGAMNGHGNGRGIATVQSILASGGANGVRLMSDAGRARVLEQQSDGVDIVIGLEMRWGMGYSLDKAFFGVPQSRRVAWWGGNGGSMSYVDLDARMSVGYVPNRWLAGDAASLLRARSIVLAAYAALENAQRRPERVAAGMAR